MQTDRTLANVNRGELFDNTHTVNTHSTTRYRNKAVSGERTWRPLTIWTLFIFCNCSSQMLAGVRNRFEPSRLELVKSDDDCKNTLSCQVLAEVPTPPTTSGLQTRVCLVPVTFEVSPRDICVCCRPWFWQLNSLFGSAEWLHCTCCPIDWCFLSSVSLLWIRICPSRFKATCAHVPLKKNFLM